MDVYSTNNWYGWLHMFLAHLLVNCGVAWCDLVGIANREFSQASEYYYQDHYGWRKEYVNHPEWKERYMSDNQCIMLVNRYFFRINDNNIIALPNCTDDYKPTKKGYGIDLVALKYWENYVRH